MANEPARITNNGELPWRDAFDGVEYEALPGTTCIVPRDAIVIWFGDGQALNTDREAKRTMEQERMSVRYGVLDFSVTEDPTLAWLRESIVPTTMSGDPISTVVHDWEGRHIVAARPTVSEQEELFELVRRQQEESAAMRAELIKLQRANEALSHSDVVEDKVGPAIASRSRRKTNPKADAIEEDVVPFGAEV